MRFDFLKHRTRYATLLITVLFITLIFSSFHVFYDSNESTSSEFLSLSVLDPDDIIHYQQVRPNRWIDYVAISASLKSYPEVIAQSVLQHATTQLDSGISFQHLSWHTENNEIKETANYYHKLLRKHPIFNSKKYSFPLKEKSYYENTYGASREAGVRSHEGTDLFNKRGTAIFSITSGIIEKKGWNRLGGERVGVRGDDGNYYYYAHLDRINADLTLNQRVRKGDLIGWMGNTGDAITTPDHLHLGIQLPNEEWINPYPFLKVWESFSF